MAVRPVVWYEMEVGGRSAGRIEMELYADVVPRTVENFRCLCTGERGAKLSYGGSAIHRVIRNFMIQGGDIERGDGTGSVSIYGEKFDDENFILKHDRPYLLSMANAGKDSNGSQFFLTVKPTPHLDGKHVVFGCVTKGQDIVLAISNLATDAQDRPRVTVEIAASGQCEVIQKPEGYEEKIEEIATAIEASDSEPEAEEVDTSSMTGPELRLFKLRLALNRSRKANAVAVKSEKTRKADLRMSKSEDRQVYEAKRKRELEDRGLSLNQGYLIDSTQNLLRRQEALDKKQQNKGAYGWEVFNQDTLRRAYEKRLDYLPSSDSRVDHSDDDEDDLETNDQVKPEAVDRMVAELKEKEKRGAAFSRRRPDLPGADVDYINKRNKHFNKKIKRAFDQYTTEIRQNLERGTAI